MDLPAQAAAMTPKGETSMNKAKYYVPPHLRKRAIPPLVHKANEQKHTSGANGAKPMSSTQAPGNGNVATMGSSSTRIVMSTENAAKETKSSKNSQVQNTKECNKGSGDMGPNMLEDDFIDLARELEGEEVDGWTLL